MASPQVRHLLISVVILTVMPFLRAEGGRVLEASLQEDTALPDGDPLQYRSYLKSLFKDGADMQADRPGGASSMQPEGGYSRVTRALLADGAAPTCDGPTYSMCYSAVGDPYCCPMNADGSGKYYMCYSTEEHTCMNVADMSDVITVEPGSGPPNSHVSKVQVPEVDSPEACYTVYPGTAGICGLVCGKAYCCPPEAPYCVGAQECLPDDGTPKLHECAGSSGAY